MSITFNRPITILMMGAPGVGKGTFSRFLSRDLRLPELSSGAELRRLIKTGKGELVEEIKRIQASGKLVSDQIVLKMIVQRMNDREFQNGCILDGFPRTRDQAIAFNQYKQIDMAIKIDLNENILVKKLTGRRECSKCQRNYNLFSIQTDGYDMEPLLPKREGVCDECNGNLIQRSDDNEKTIVTRMETYKKLTVPMENYFRDRGVPITTFEPRRGVQDYATFKELVLRNLRNLH